MFTKSEQKKGLGMILLGFMGLMTGMDLMSDSMAFLKEEAWFGQLMISFSNPILGILFGAVLTGLIQSSSASVGILQSLCATGAVSFGTAIPIILGAPKRRAMMLVGLRYPKSQRRSQPEAQGVYANWVKSSER